MSDIEDFYNRIMYGASPDGTPDGTDKSGGLAGLLGSGLFGVGAPEGTLDASQQAGLRNGTLMGIASGLLEAGGPSTTRVSMGQALGQGLKNGMKVNNDQLNNYFKQNLYAQQARASQADTMTKQLGTNMNIAKYNMFARLNGLPEMALNQNNKVVQGMGVSSAPDVMITSKPITGGSMPSVFNGGVVGGNAIPTAPVGSPAGGPSASSYDPSDTSQQTLQSVYMGAIPGSPQQHAALSNMLGFAGDKESADYHRKMAYEGVNGFRPDPQNWNGQQTPLGEKAPGYIGQTAMAKAMPDAYARAAYAYPTSAGENAGKWFGPNPVGLDTKLAGGGMALPNIPLPGQFYGSPGQGAPAPAQSAPAYPAVQPAYPAVQPAYPVNQGGRAPSSAIPPAPMGIPAPGPGPGLNTGLPSAGGINPGPFTNPSGGAAKEALSELGKADASEVAKTRESARTSLSDLQQIQTIQDFMPKVSTGWSSETKQEAAQILAAAGVDKSVIEKSILGVDPAAGQILQKNFLQLSSAAVRGMGAREPGSVISMFSKAYPSLGTDPEAIALQTNALKMDRLRQQAEASSKENYLYGSIADAQSGKGYKGLNGFSEAFNSTNDPRMYLRAAEAMSAPTTPSFAGHITSTLKGLSPTEYKKVISLIPSGSTFMDRNGTVHVRQ